MVVRFRHGEKAGGAQEQLFWNICSLSIFLGLSLGTTPSLQLVQVSAALSAIYSNFLWDHPHFASNFLKPLLCFLVNISKIFI